METNEIVNALACLVPAAFVGLLAAFAHRRSFAPAMPKLAPIAPLPAPAMPAIAAPWQTRNYDALGDTARSFMATKDAAAQALPGKTETYRHAPARAAGFVSDVVVPLCWALLAGFFVGGFVAVVVACIPQVAAYWPGGGGASAFLAAAAVLIWRMVDHAKLLWLTEEMTHQDLDGDKHIGKPPTVHHEATITDRRKGHSTQWEVTWPGNYGKLCRFAAKVTSGQPFTEKTATDAGYTSFEQLRDLFMLNGWADWRNPDAHTLGVELDDVGKQALEQMTED